MAATPNLGDDGDLEAKVVESDFGNVNPVNEDLSFCCLFDPKQAEHQGGLPGPGPSDDAHLSRAGSRVRTAAAEAATKAGAGAETGSRLPSGTSPSKMN